MKLAWRRVRRSWLIFSLMLASGGSLVLWSEHHARSAEAGLVWANNALTNAERRLLALRTQQSELASAQALLADWRSTPLPTGTRQAAWRASLKELGNTFGIIRLDNEFEPPRAHAPSAEGQENWFAYPMQVRIQAVHEGILLDSLHQITQRKDAIVVAHRCTFSRMPTLEAHGDIAMRCDMTWFSMQPMPERT